MILRPPPSENTAERVHVQSRGGGVSLGLQGFGGKNAVTTAMGKKTRLLVAPSYGNIYTFSSFAPKISPPERLPPLCATLKQRVDHS